LFQTGIPDIWDRAEPVFKSRAAASNEAAPMYFIFK
jgi:hypothetical protein